MCWMCDLDGRAEFTRGAWVEQFGSLSAHVGASRTGLDIGFLPADGIGDLKSPSPTSLLVLTGDDVPDSIQTTKTLTVGAPSIVSTIDTIGDQDFYKVTLEAGKTYELGNYAYVGGPSLTPLADAYLELYDAAGNLITSADGGATTVFNQVNSGFDVLLVYTPKESGTYYVNARSFDNSPADGSTTGEFVGDYELFVREQPFDPNAYKPYYDVDSPLYALDWGTQVNRVNGSVRNPDGNEGTRDTGNAAGTPEIGNPANAVTGKNVITIYFAKAGDIFTSLEDPTSPGLPPVLVSAGTQAWEREVVFTSLREFEKVADVVYVEVDTREEADFFFTTYKGTPGPGVSLLGSMAPPDYPDEGLAQFNSGDYRWTEQNLQQGGFSYVTLIHEFGHGHGLAHPHDNGGRSGVMRGVEGEGAGVADYTTGDFDLNQGIHTMMSYEDGWQKSPYGNAPTDAGYGYLGGLMAFDIAAIQDKYGVNEEWATGDDSYVLKDVNAAGTFYSSIWDGGGTDEIVYGGARDAVIDLRPASLKYEVGGGGNVSYASGIFGGFTVANGVTIENARSGSGNDTLNGNDAANRLDGGAGNDRINGFGGNDMLVAALGDDVMDGGDGLDTADYSGNAGNVRIDLQMTGVQDTGSTGRDTLVALENVIGGAGRNQFYGNGASNRLEGGAGADNLDGRGGNDVIVGGSDYDTLFGGAGADLFVFNTASETAVGGARDKIYDFALGIDKIDLSGIDANIAFDGNDAFLWIGNNAFDGVAGQLRASKDSSGFTIIAGDTNGDGRADFEIALVNQVTPTEADFLL